MEQLIIAVGLNEYLPRSIKPNIPITPINPNIPITPINVGVAA